MLKKLVIIVILFFTSSNMYPISDTVQYFIVKVKIEGVHLNLIFDNGAQKTVLFNSQLLNEHNSFEAGLISASKDTVVAKISKNRMTIELANFDIVEKLQIVSIPNNMEIVTKLYNIDGILGNDLISKYDWYFNFKTYTISRVKNKPKKNINRDDFIALNITKNQDRDFLEFDFLNTDGGVYQNIPLFVDFGKTGIISINDTLNIPNIQLYKNLHLNTTAGGTAVRVSDLSTSNIKLNKYLLHNMILNIYPKSQNQSNAIGLGFFKMFDKVYLLNSEKKILLSTITNYTYKIKSITKKEGKIFNMLIPLNEFTKAEDFIENNLIINPNNVADEAIEFGVKVKKE
jgi:hypothetical protein